MSLPDYLLDPEDDGWCDIHDLWFLGRCPECLQDAIDEQADADMKGRY